MKKSQANITHTNNASSGPVSGVILTRDKSVPMSLRDKLEAWYLSYEVISGTYHMDSWEKIIMNSILLLLTYWTLKLVFSSVAAWF
eukprot:c705_g1_i1.p1 GENE.c705_g1_i1~~c705_g1_i1.p1  ORF type:complete len:100 (-),score=18.14 c705_g1_i1:68-325(-)